MNRAFSEILNLLFPRRCIFCREYLPHDADTPVCRRCAAAHPPLPPRELTIAVGKCYYILDYRAEVRRAILGFKFRGLPQYAAAFGPLLSPAVNQWGSVDCITWAPVSALRLAKRGYDQSRLLAEAAGAALGIPVRQLISKRRHTRPQSRLSREKRRENVRGAYVPLKTAIPSGGRVVLIDDIVTTGSTLSACCQALYQGGAGEVLCLALAH